MGKGSSAEELSLKLLILILEVIFGTIVGSPVGC